MAAFHLFDIPSDTVIIAWGAEHKYDNGISHSFGNSLVLV